MHFLEHKFFSMNISDEQLRQYVDNVFSKYDKNGSLTLD